MYTFVVDGGAARQKLWQRKRKLMSILCITKNKTNWSTTRQKALSLTCVTAPQNTTNSFDICYLSVRKKQNLSSF
jgi:hypothetical protein